MVKWLACIFVAVVSRSWWGCAKLAAGSSVVTLRHCKEELWACNVEEEGSKYEVLDFKMRC